jgi:hypothetical protein
LQAELHGGIKKTVDRLKRHREAFRNAAERKADLESFLVDFQIPELVLQDNRHFVGILGAQAIRQANAVGAGIE